MSRKRIAFKNSNDSGRLKKKALFEQRHGRTIREGKDFTDEEVHEMLCAFIEGSSVDTIASKLRRPPSTIYNKIRKVVRKYTKADADYTSPSPMPNRDHEEWTAGDKYITEHWLKYDKGNFERLSMFLGRSVKSLKKRLRVAVQGNPGFGLKAGDKKKPVRKTKNRKTKQMALDALTQILSILKKLDD